MMASDSEVRRVEAIKGRISILYGLDINPIISELLDQLVLDVEWMTDRLNSAWSIVNAYQDEVRRLYNEGK
jgi:hypothetical protein